MLYFTITLLPFTIYTLKLTGTSIKSVKTSNSKVATVSKKGKVVAKKSGTATITLTGKDGKKYTCIVIHKHFDIFISIAYRNGTVILH